MIQEFAKFAKTIHYTLTILLQNSLIFKENSFSWWFCNVWDYLDLNQGEGLYLYYQLFFLIDSWEVSILAIRNPPDFTLGFLLILISSSSFSSSDIRIIPTRYLLDNYTKNLLLMLLKMNENFVLLLMHFFASKKTQCAFFPTVSFSLVNEFPLSHTNKKVLFLIQFLQKLLYQLYSKHINI